jgi:hypothetical protein
MELSTINYHFSDIGKVLTIQIPNTCPNCGIGNNPTSSLIGSSTTQGGKVYNMLHLCPSCNKNHFTIQKYINLEDKTTMLLVYPNKVIIDIDPVFIKHAPRFVEFYSEAVEAEKMGLVNIAGTGYRSAIECLIKDYALAFELDDKEYLSDPKFSFNNAIDKYLKNDELLKGTVHFIRKVGNGYTHWDKNTSIPITTLKNYVEIIIQVFKAKFMMKYLPEA